jgi:endonuclease V-like protein UPF0215 family
MKSPIHLEKRGIRALAIAESFKADCRYAVLAGVVMRRDMIIDGVVMSKSTLRGDDATQNIIAMYRNMHRNDISCIFLGGIIISMYNIVDGAEIHKSTKLPIIALTFRPSEGIETTIKRVFSREQEAKLQQYQNLGQREEVKLGTGKSVFVRRWGISLPNAAVILDHFTLQGSYPEPIRIAKLIARARDQKIE